MLDAYRRAADSISIDTMVSTLNQLDYVYPYHQVVGFYLQRAGIKVQSLEPLKSLGIKLNFYLAHGMVEPSLDPNWKVFFDRALGS